MRLSTIVFAVLPALALAQETESTSTKTVVATTTLTKTYTLSNVHTIIATPGYNSTATQTPSSSTMTQIMTTSEPKPTTVDEGSAGSALGAGRMALVGVAGMAALALL